MARRTDELGNPTRKPRINLVVEPDVFETIRAVAQSQGRSSASVVMELVNSAYPFLSQLRRTLEKAATLPPEARPATLQALQEVEDCLTPVADLADAALDYIEASVTPQTGGKGA